MNAINYGYENYKDDLSEGSQSVYKGIIKNFSEFLDDELNLDDVLGSEINSSITNRYKNYLLKNGITPQIVKMRLVVLSSLYIHFIDDHDGMIDRIPQNPFKITYRSLNKLTAQLPARRRAEIQEKTLSEEEVELIRTFEFHGTKKHKHNRWRLTVLWQIYTGFSFNDLCEYNWEIKKTDKGKEFIEMFRGKTGNRCVIPYTKDAKWVYEQLNELNPKFLFPVRKCKSRKRKHGELNRYNTFLRSFEKKLGIKLHTHLFRHTFGMMMSKKGVRLDHISAMMGHSSVSMTESFYVRPQDDDIIDAVNDLF